MLTGSNGYGTLVDNANRRVKISYWIWLFACIAFYIGCNSIIIAMSIAKKSTVFANVSKYTLNGVLAQGQVIAVILISLNPIKLSYIAALFLCGFTSMSSLMTVLAGGGFDALPGVIVPLTSAAMSLIIHNYGRRFKDQLQRVLEYSGIVKKNEEMLHYLAYYDMVTGLPNRTTLMDQIDMLTEKDDPERKGFYLVYMDIDDFKIINDTLGHNAGDSVLKEAARRWESCCRNEDLLARVGGDEFVLLICSEMDPKQLREYLIGFRSVLKAPILSNHKEFSISVSFGIARYPDDGKNGEELMQNADIALYKAKKLGKDRYLFFSAKIRDEVVRKIKLENDLLSAIGNGELYMVYQPQYHCGSLKLKGFEALIRWKHPELGLISPAEFIPISERAGMIIDIGRWVLENTLNVFSELQRNAQIQTVVSVNISVEQLSHPGFAAMVSDILAKTCFNSRFLVLEMTESVFITEPEYITGVLRRLKEMGIGLALDDFGTKYASLNYLQMLPVTMLKIDKTFIDQISPSHLMTGAVISLSHKLGMEVMAEGVETKEQLDYLSENGCDYIQGYLLSKPVEKEQIEPIYRDNATA